MTLKDFTPDEIMYLVDLAADLKERKTGNYRKFSEREEHCIDF